MLRPSCRCGSSPLAYSFWGRKNVFTVWTQSGLIAKASAHRILAEADLRRHIRHAASIGRGGLGIESKRPAAFAGACLNCVLRWDVFDPGVSHDHVFGRIPIVSFL